MYVEDVQLDVDTWRAACRLVDATDGDAARATCGDIQVASA